MKRSSVPLFLVFLLSLNSKSQITKKNWMMGGNAAFSSTEFHSDLFGRNTVTIFQISPDIGYFFIDRLAAGARVSFDTKHGKATATAISSKYNTTSIGPFVRYYFLKPGKQTNILIEGAYQYGTEKGDSWKYKKNTFAFAAGPVIFLNTVVGLEFLVGYSSTKYVDFDGNNNTIQLGAGFQIHLEKEKK